MNFCNWKKIVTEKETFFIRFSSSGSTCSFHLTNFLEVYHCFLNKKEIEEGITVSERKITSRNTFQILV